LNNRLSTIIDAGGQLPSDALTLLDLWAIARNRRLWIGTIMLAFAGAAITASVLSTRRYKATGEIQVQKDSSDALGLDSLMGSAPGGAGDALDANVTLQTQAKVLESQTLGLQVINQLHLENTSDFEPRFNPLGRILGVLSPKGVADPVEASLEASPRKRDWVFSVFKSNTKIVPVPGTRLIEVSYTSPDPKIAAAVVNQLISSLTDFNFQTRYTATSQASEWLGKQLSDLRTNSEDLQGRVAELQRNSGVYTFGGEDIEGKGIAYSTVLDQLQQATAHLAQAQANRVVKGALYEAAKAGDPEMIAGLSSSSLMGDSSPAVGNSLALIQALRTQEATQKGLISEASAKFGVAYPKLEEMHANLTSIQESIRAEQGRLEKQTKSEFVVAQQVEDHMNTIFTEQKRGAEAMNNKAIQYQMVRQEAEQSTGLYQKLLSRLKEAGVLEGLKSSNITVVEPGRVPSRPAQPNVKLYLAAALCGGLFFGFGSAFGLEMMDSKVRDLQVTANRFGDALFGELPFERMKSTSLKKKANRQPSSPIFTLDDPQSGYSEALRALRTAVLLSRGGSPPKVILVTSSVMSEGKSTLAGSLAALLAQQGKHVLLVDADLRRPRLHKLFGISGATGLSTLLTSGLVEGMARESLHRVDGVRGLTVLPAGPVPPYPSELLGSDEMNALLSLWRNQFDFIVLDGAPVLPVTDSVVLAPLADQILLMARYGVTERSQLDRSFRLLLSCVSSTAVGIVVNAVKRTAEDYYSAYGYSEKANRKDVQLHA
jgi:succinoglycan biosynthesis transport protein ExoP